MLSSNPVAVALIVVGILEIVFWTYFFLVENRNPKNSEVYLAFERSFPVADLLWLTPCCLIGAYGLFTGSRYGTFFVILSGCSLFFLSLLDISFNAQNRGYTEKVSDGILNGVMNTLCFLVGIWFMAYGWVMFIG